jgi:hypothetical protein
MEISSFTELLEAGASGKMCTKFPCTTCGGLPFRNALMAFTKDEVLSELRQLSEEFLAKNNAMFRLIVSEISVFPTGGELLSHLEGSAAAKQLLANIDFQNQRFVERQAYLASQTPEAIAHSRLLRKAERLDATAPHRDKKLVTIDLMQAASDMLDLTPDNQVLEIIIDTDLGVSKEALSGLVFSRLRKFYKINVIEKPQLDALSFLADAYSGHWVKLLNEINSR